VISSPAPGERVCRFLSEPLTTGRKAVSSVYNEEKGGKKERRKRALSPLRESSPRSTTISARRSRKKEKKGRTHCLPVPNVEGENAPTSALSIEGSERPLARV